MTRTKKPLARAEHFKGPVLRLDPSEHKLMDGAHRLSELRRYMSELAPRKPQQRAKKAGRSR